MKFIALKTKDSEWKYQALILKQPKNVDIPNERTVYRVMEEIGLNHQPRRKPNGITKAPLCVQTLENASKA